MISNLFKFIRKLKAWEILFYLGLFAVFIANAFHESYPDEFDNILGGWNMLHGRFLYSGFFTHHGPVPYMLAAVLELFSWQSFVRFRVVYEIALVLFNIFVYKFYKEQIGEKVTRFYPIFLILLGIGSTYFWLHMLLADNLAAIVLTAVYGLIILKRIYGVLFDRRDLIFISVLSALGLYSSLTFTYVYGIIFITTLYIYFAQAKFSFKNIRKGFIEPLIILLIPHVIFGIYLLVTWSLPDYLYQNFVFNSKYYIYNYPRPEGATINPIRYAVLIAHEFFNSFYTIITGLQSLNLTFPMNNLMAFADLALLIYAFLSKRVKLGLFILALLIYSNVRSHPLSKETDYQAAVYIFFSLLNSFIVIQVLAEKLRENIAYTSKIIYTILFSIAVILSLAGGLFVIQKFGDKYYAKYMGNAPLIYDRPEIAPILNKITDKNDIAWIGPFEFEELFYLNRVGPSKYQILIPGMGKSPKIQADIIAAYKKNPPAVLYFDPNFFILGSQTKYYSGFFLDYLNQNYYTLLPYREGDTVYRSSTPIHDGEKLDLETKLYIRKDKMKEVLVKLVSNGYIHTKNEPPVEPTKTPAKKK